LHRKAVIPKLEKVIKSDEEFIELNNYYRVFCGKVDSIFGKKFDYQTQRKTPKFMDHIYIR